MSTSVNTGIDNRQVVADGLSRYLANSYTLYLKTQNFHWNVTGPNFSSLHLMFEGQYTDLQGAVDLIAERIRALGFYAPASYKEFSKLSDIAEANGKTKATDMVSQLLADHQTMVRLGRELMHLAQKEGDDVTVDLLNGRLDIHEKTAWMLRSTLE